jgi:hypothetical protein
MRKPACPCAHALVVLSLLGLVGCYSTVEVGDGPTDKAITIDLVEPPCAVPGSPAGYIEGNGFGAENVTITVDGIPAEVLAATGKDASFIVPAEGLSPGETIEVVVMNPGGRLATINWVVCGPGPDTDPPVLVDFDFNPKSVDVSTQAQNVTCTMSATDVPSGVNTVGCQFQSPSGSGIGCAAGSPPPSGDRFDGVWTCDVTIPQNGEAGVWTVSRVDAYDEAGNMRRYLTPELRRSASRLNST